MTHDQDLRDNGCGNCDGRGHLGAEYHKDGSATFEVCPKCGFTAEQLTEFVKELKGDDEDIPTHHTRCDRKTCNGECLEWHH